MQASISDIAYYLPKQELTNDQLADPAAGWDAAKILEKTGIATRHIAAPDECSSDLAVAAAEALFARGTCDRNDIDFLLLCTQSPDYFLPTTACVVQDRLKLRTSCGAIDINQGCSGFVYGLAVGKGLIETGLACNVLLITAETYSKFINARDRSVRTIFGDAAAATLLTADAEATHDLIGPFVFGTDGRGAQNLIVPGGGMRLPRSKETSVEREEKGNWRSDENLYMNGPEIFNFTLSAVPKAVDQLLSHAGISHPDVDYYVFHQANRFMIERLRTKIGIAPERFCVDMESCGNTVSSTIPIALRNAIDAGRVAAGASVMVVGFGVGYSWAAAMIRNTVGASPTQIERKRAAQPAEI